VCCLNHDRFFAIVSYHLIGSITSVGVASFCCSMYHSRISRATNPSAWSTPLSLSPSISTSSLLPFVNFFLCQNCQLFQRDHFYQTILSEQSWQNFQVMAADGPSSCSCTPCLLPNHPWLQQPSPGYSEFQNCLLPHHLRFQQLSPGFSEFEVTTGVMIQLYNLQHPPQ